jgi:uncharacterized protein (UPF0332 family)
MERQTEELIRGQLSRAEEKPQAAKALLAAHFIDDAISRAYYAIFHAASAVLLAEGITVGSHHALVTMFGLYLVKPGKIARRFSRILSRLKDEREGGDYDIFSAFETEDADRAVADAEGFLQEMQRYLRESYNLPPAQ